MIMHSHIFIHSDSHISIIVYRCYRAARLLATLLLMNCYRDVNLYKSNYFEISTLLIWYWNCVFLERLLAIIRLLHVYVYEDISFSNEVINCTRRHGPMIDIKGAKGAILKISDSNPAPPLLVQKKKKKMK